MGALSGKCTCFHISDITAVIPLNL